MRWKSFKAFLRKVGVFDFYLAIIEKVEELYWVFRRFNYNIKLNRHINKGLEEIDNVRILVVLKKGGIGNAIEATPLVQAIRAIWPSCHLTLVPPPCGDLFDDWCVLDRVVTTVQEIEGEQFDHTFAAYLYEDLNFWGKYCDLGKIHQLNKWQKKWFLKPEREYYLGFLKSYGYKGTVPPCYVTVKKPEKLLSDTGLRICIVPCGRNEGFWKSKKWPYYPELIQALREQYSDSQVCIIGTTDDHIEIDFDGEMIVDCRSKYSLSETAWLLKHSDLVIGNDCGPMHIASAVGVPSIVIFGPTCIIKNEYSGKVTMLCPENRKCWPCQYDGFHMQTCTSGECINSIDTRKVMEQCIKKLNQASEENVNSNS